MTSDRKPERARNEGSKGPKRLDDTRCTTGLRVEVGFWLMANKSLVLLALIGIHPKPINPQPSTVEGFGLRDEGSGLKAED